MRDELLERAAQAVESSRQAGAAQAWAWASRSRSVSFEMRDGVLEQVKDSTSRALQLRLFVEGRYSSHSTTELRPGPLGEFVEEAVALTRALQPDPHRVLPDPSLYGGAPGDLDLVDGRVERLERGDRLAACEAMNERVVGLPGVVSATTGARDGFGVIAGVSSNGFSSAYETTSAAIFAEVTLTDGERRPEGSMGAAARYVAGLPEAAGVADEALRQARARIGAKKGPTACTAMVVDPRAAGSLIGRLLGPASGGSVQQQRSFWRGRIGEKAVSERLTILDDPLIPRGLGSRPFDGEGIAARRLPVLEAGVLRNLYVDTYYASKLGIRPTTGGSSNRLISLGSRGLQAIVSAVGTGVYVTGWLGGNMDSTTGDFSFGARGHRIEQGAIGAPVGEMNVTGNILELFSRLAEVGNDPWPYSATIVPTLVFDAVQFSGS